MNNKLDQEINIVNSSIKKTILILSNDDIIIQLGVLKKLKQLNLLDNIDTIIASSKGSILAFFYALGYNFEELYNLFRIEKNIEDLSPIIKNITFRDLFKKTKIKLIITGTCLNEKKITYFSHENFPEMKIIAALNIANSFVPISYNNKLYIDGSCIEFFPISLFKNKLNEIIGIYIESHEMHYIHDIIYYLCEDIVIKNLFIVRCANVIIIDKKNIKQNDPDYLYKYGYDICSMYE
jgi:predicted acylesterase/phospholipase RssA